MARARADFEVLEYPGYDWRLNLNDSVAKLNVFVDANKGSAGRVYLVAHSMGGLLARAYVADEVCVAKLLASSPWARRIWVRQQWPSAW